MNVQRAEDEKLDEIAERRRKFFAGGSHAKDTRFGRYMNECRKMKK